MIFTEEIWSVSLADWSTIISDQLREKIKMNVNIIL